MLLARHRVSNTDGSPEAWLAEGELFSVWTLRCDDECVRIERMFDQPPWFRPLDAPRQVWVDVQHLLPRHTHQVYRSTPDGLDLDREVIGLVDAWARRADGGWLARVSYQLSMYGGKAPTELITHYVPAHLMRPQSYGRRGRERSGLGH